MERTIRRGNDPPILSYDERIAGSGQLIRGSIALPLTRFVLTRRRYDPESEWEFQGSSTEATHSVWSALLSPGRADLSFEGTDEKGERIVIRDLHFEQQQGREITARAQTVDRGEPQLQGECEFQHVRIALWPTDLAEPEVVFPFRSWTGEIKVWRTRPRMTAQKILVRLARRRLRFSRHYDWDDALVEDQKSTVRIPVATLSGRLPVRQRTLDVEALCDELAQELEDLTPVLSLLSRRHVRWSRIVITTHWRAENDRGHDSFSRIRGSRSSHRGRKAEALVVPGRMPATWLQELSTRFCQLPSKASVASAIIYLIAAHDSGFVDAAVANAYTAFETALNALAAPGSAYTLTASPFRALASQLRETIREFTSAKGVSDDTRDAVIEKIPELRRRSLVDRAVQYIESNAIDVTGLWPGTVPLESGLGALLRRRNRFVHTGELGSLHQASIDAERLAMLTERMLAHALGVESHWFSPLVIANLSYLSHTPEPAEE